LAQDLLFDFVIKAGHKCFRCGEELRRKDFTIEHKTPWLGSEDPLGLYFDLENIAYSHAACNYRAGRRPNKLNRTSDELKAVNAARERAKWNSLDKDFRKARRRLSYEKYGC
jgi:hypothetical protein